MFEVFHGVAQHGGAMFVQDLKVSGDIRRKQADLGSKPCSKWTGFIQLSPR
jgi:hypothetical protein